MEKIKLSINKICGIVNNISVVILIIMMGLTFADVILRLFRCPIPGTYEIIGFLSALFVSFSLAQTALDQGHIAVDFFVLKLKEQARQKILVINSIICSVFFAVISWQSIEHALRVQLKGEVSSTLQIPIYPIFWGISVGLAMLSLMLVLDVIDKLKSEKTK